MGIKIPEALSCSGGSHPPLHIRITWGAFKSPDTEASPRTDFFAMSGGGIHMQKEAEHLEQKL